MHRHDLWPPQGGWNVEGALPQRGRPQDRLLRRWRQNVLTFTCRQFKCAHTHIWISISLTCNFIASCHPFGQFPRLCAWDKPWQGLKWVRIFQGISSKTRCRRPTSTSWPGSCTTGATNAASSCCVGSTRLPDQVCACDRERECPFDLWPWWLFYRPAAAPKKFPAWKRRRVSSHVAAEESSVWLWSKASGCSRWFSGGGKRLLLFVMPECG